MMRKTTHGSSTRSIPKLLDLRVALCTTIATRLSRSFSPTSTTKPDVTFCFLTPRPASSANPSSTKSIPSSAPPISVSRYFTQVNLDAESVRGQSSRPRFAFSEIGLHQLSLDVFSFNPRAIRAYEKAGFVREGALRDAVIDSATGSYGDDILMSILESEWREHR